MVKGKEAVAMPPRPRQRGVIRVMSEWCLGRWGCHCCDSGSAMDAAEVRRTTTAAWTGRPIDTSRSDAAPL